MFKKKHDHLIFDQIQHPLFYLSIFSIEDDEMVMNATQGPISLVQQGKGCVIQWLITYTRPAFLCSSAFTMCTQLFWLPVHFFTFTLLWINFLSYAFTLCPHSEAISKSVLTILYYFIKIILYLHTCTTRPVPLH